MSKDKAKKIKIYLEVSKSICKISDTIHIKYKYDNYFKVSVRHK